MSIDWRAVIVDLEQRGVTLSTIAIHQHAAKSTVWRWRSGKEPPYADGARLLRLWADATNSAIQDAPTHPPCPE